MAGAKQTPGTKNDGICPSKKRKRTESTLQGGTLMSDEYSQPTNLMKVRTSTCICSLGFQFKLPAPHSSYLRQKVKVKSFSRNRFFATPGTYHTPPSMGFSRHESWSGLPLPSPLQIESTLKWSFTKGSSNDYRFLKSDFVQLKVKYFVLISETVHFKRSTWLT